MPSWKEGIEKKMNQMIQNKFTLTKEFYFFFGGVVSPL